MSELLQAAKAAISAMDTLHVQVPWVRPVFEQLRAAVERVEKQEVAGFEDWWGHQDTWHCYKNAARKSWTAAQQAERERIKAIINGVDVHSNWDSGVLSTLRRMQDMILEKIDE